MGRILMAHFGWVACVEKKLRVVDAVSYGGISEQDAYFGALGE